MTRPPAADLRRHRRGQPRYYSTMFLALTILVTVLVSAAVFFPVLIALQHPELVAQWYRKRRNRRLARTSRARSLYPAEPNDHASGGLVR